jgi:hypothetical protein
MRRDKIAILFSNFGTIKILDCVVFKVKKGVTHVLKQARKSL